jgi:hypothetical protein
MKGPWLSWARKTRRTSSETGALPAVAVLGAMRSGTNLVRHLLEKHWEVEAGFSAYGWKHAGVPVLSPSGALAYPDLPILYVVKNPYAFVLSLHRYHRLAVTKGHRISIDGAENLAQFLVRPVTLRDSQLEGSPQMRFANPVQYWNYIYWNLETLDRSRFRARGVNYETILSDPECLSLVEKIARLRRRLSPVTLPDRSMRRTNDGDAVDTVSDGGFDAGYYTDERYLAELTPEQVAFIGREADPWIMSRRGYRRV